MTRYVIGPDVALRLAQEEVSVPTKHQLLAPTLIRSQMLAQLHGMVRRGELERSDAERQLDYLRRLRMRLLGDRVLQRVAWRIADQVGWEDTFVAEYIALTQLQADAFVCLDPDLAHAVRDVVPLANIEDLMNGSK